MDSLSVHIAVLTISNEVADTDRATAQAIVECARAAGHEIVGEATVKDHEGTIRDQLVRWIAEPEIDVVIAVASMESDAASAALAPLIMQTLPGFTDLFRWLTFQEIGASAMLSAAEAAQCESTFVFVLPAHEAAVRAAMDKLILPQLDANTRPKNLVTQMPRLKERANQRAQTEPTGSMTTPAAAHHAVPVPIVAEKTSGGSGLPPKLPARTRQPTANIIARRPADPPTKEIDLARLEKQIELSNVNDAQTKQIQVGAHDAKTKVVDMSAHQAKTRVVESGRVLPRVPPGADDGAFDEDDSLTFAEPPSAMAKRIPSLTGKGSPAATPPFATPIARSAAADRHTAATPPAATPQLRPAPADRSDRHTAPTPPAATPQLRGPGSKQTAALPPATKPPATMPPATTPHAATPPAVTPPAATPPATTTSAATPPLARPRQPTPPPPPAVKHPPTQPPPAATKRRPTEPPPPPMSDDKKRPAPNAAELWSRAIESPSESTAAEAATSVRDDSAPAREPVAASGAAARPDDAASDPGEDRAVDTPSPIAAVLADSGPRVRKPTPPPLPQVDPLAGLISRPIDGGELPQGDFAYPIKRSGGALLLKLLAAVAVAGLGFLAFIELYPGGEKPARTAAVTPPTAPPEVAAPVEPSPAPAADPAATGSATAPEVEPEIEMDSSGPGDTDTSGATPRPRPPRRGGGSHASTHRPSASSKPAGAEPTSHDSSASADGRPTPAPGDDGPAAAPASDPGCDEVSCVLSKYDRPCCERFKPTETFTPKNVVPDSLDRTMVKAGVEKIKPRIVACGEKYHGKGTVKLAVSVDGAGKVKSASVSETPDPALGDCVERAMRDATFGKSVNGGEFVYPFVF